MMRLGEKLRQAAFTLRHQQAVEIDERIFVVIQRGMAAAQLAVPECFLLHEGLVEMKTRLVKRHMQGLRHLRGDALGTERTQLVKLHLPRPGMASFRRLQPPKTHRMQLEKHQQVFFHRLDWFAAG